LEGLVRLWSDPQVTLHIGGPRQRDLVFSSFAEYVAHPSAHLRMEGECWWTMALRLGHNLVGLCRLTDGRDDPAIGPELGYFLFPQFWGHGYASEACRAVLDYAFSTLVLPSVAAIVHPDNLLSAAVASGLLMKRQDDVLRPDGMMRRLYRVRRDELDRCPGCQAWFVPSEGSIHGTFGSSPGCWSAFGDILAMEFGPWQCPPIHRVTVHAYAAQHPGTESPDTIQSVAGHLIGLHWFLERQEPGERAIRALARATAARGSFAWLEPPVAGLGEVNVWDVRGAGDVAEHTQRVEDWARCVWTAWSPHHPTIRAWAARLDI
jgi:RimJ/RimL family protein N-acetyltransferase